MCKRILTGYPDLVSLMKGGHYEHTADSSREGNLGDEWKKLPGIHLLSMRE